MDTYGAIRRLQTHGLTLEQAEDITAVIQEAIAPVPSQMELRTFVLEQDLKLERLRTEMHQEFGRMHAAIVGLSQQLTGVAELVRTRRQRS
jgi:hypothetical protein